MRAMNAPSDPQVDSLRVQPHSIAAEQSVLGGLLLHNAAGDRIAYLDRAKESVTGSADAASIDTRGSDYDAVLGVYTGAAVNALTLVAADDNAMNPDARVTFAATSGVTYYVAVDGAAGDRGQVTLGDARAGRHVGKRQSRGLPRQPKPIAGTRDRQLALFGGDIFVFHYCLRAGRLQPLSTVSHRSSH